VPEAPTAFSRLARRFDWSQYHHPKGRKSGSRIKLRSLSEISDTTIFSAVLPLQHAFKFRKKFVRPAFENLGYLAAGG
jgi:hypothetical protein